MLKFQKSVENSSTTDLQKFRLAIDLNQIEYGREAIIRSKELKCDQYRELLEYALINGKPDFVELLINTAIHSTRFINLDAFARIYQQGLLYEMKHNQQELYL